MYKRRRDTQDTTLSSRSFASSSLKNTKRNVGTVANNTHRKGGKNTKLIIYPPMEYMVRQAYNFFNPRLQFRHIFINNGFQGVPNNDVLVECVNLTLTNHQQYAGKANTDTSILTPQSQLFGTSVASTGQRTHFIGGYCEYTVYNTSELVQTFTFTEFKIAKGLHATGFQETPFQQMVQDDRNNGGIWADFRPRNVTAPLNTLSPLNDIASLPNAFNGFTVVQRGAASSTLENYPGVGINTTTIYQQDQPVINTIDETLAPNTLYAKYIPTGWKPSPHSTELRRYFDKGDELTVKLDPGSQYTYRLAIPGFFQTGLLPNYLAYQKYTRFLHIRVTAQQVFDITNFTRTASGKVQFSLSKKETVHYRNLWSQKTLQKVTVNDIPFDHTDPNSVPRAQGEGYNITTSNMRYINSEGETEDVDNDGDDVGQFGV